MDIKPISYLKANAANILVDLAERREALITTQNGRAKETRETLALLQLLALGAQDTEAGRTRVARQVVDRLRAKPAAS